MWNPMLQRRVELDEQLGLAGASKRWDPWVQGIVGAAQPISPPQKIQLPRASQVDRPRTQVLDPPKKTPPQTRIHDPEKAQPTPAELEAESVALALKLQQEERADFMRAISMNTTPQPQVSSTPDTRDTVSTNEDESLQLALRLQQEELRWQQLQSEQMLQRSSPSHNANLIGEGEVSEMDEDVALALRLQMEEDAFEG